MISGNCDECGKPYTTRYRRTKYCSPICRARANSKGRPRGPRNPLISMVCDYCGEAFETRRPKTQKFCSVDHRRAFNEIVDSNARVAMSAVRESVREILRARVSSNRGA